MVSGSPSTHFPYNGASVGYWLGVSTRSSATARGTCETFCDDFDGWAVFLEGSTGQSSFFSKFDVTLAVWSSQLPAFVMADCLRNLMALPTSVYLAIPASPLGSMFSASLRGVIFSRNPSPRVGHSKVELWRGAPQSSLAHFRQPGREKFGMGQHSAKRRGQAPRPDPCLRKVVLVARMAYGTIFERHWCLSCTNDPQLHAGFSFLTTSSAFSWDLNFRKGGHALRAWDRTLWR